MSISTRRRSARINWLINRTYLRLYLSGLDAVALFDTPLGGLDFGLASRPETEFRFIFVWARLASLLEQAGLRSAVEQLRWPDLITLTHEAGFRILIDGLLSSAIGSDYTGPTFRRTCDEATGGSRQVARCRSTDSQPSRCSRTCWVTAEPPWSRGGSARVGGARDVSHSAASAKLDEASHAVNCTAAAAYISSFVSMTIPRSDGSAS